MTVCLVFPGRPTLTPNDPVNYSQCHFDSQKCFGLNLDSLGKCHLRQRLLHLPMCALLLLLLLLSSFSRVRLCVTIRLHRPWDSPGKNTGVGCHFLLQCRTVKSESEVAQSCPSLQDPMDCSPPGSSIHRIFQARVLEWGAAAFSILSLAFPKLKS